MNRHGLSRDIPADRALRVRRECGFGCVLCGKSVVHYDHFNPEFKDATDHDPAGIALLCGGCHDEKSRKYLSTATIAGARLNPLCKRTGFSWKKLGLQGEPIVDLGGAQFRRSPIQIAGRRLLEVKPGEEPGVPFRLSALFTNAVGHEVLRIEDNIWKASTGSWDVACEGGRISIRSGLSDYCLILRAMPPEGVKVERLDMRLGDYHVQCPDEETFLLLHQGRVIIDARYGVFDGVELIFD
ncbi:MAG: hypothetical protein K2X87_09560 [Gemmataceae bacterium]|nr:hypothetical protein [Gemmataceae bacterium]